MMMMMMTEDREDKDGYQEHGGGASVVWTSQGVDCLSIYGGKRIVHNPGSE